MEYVITFINTNHAIKGESSLMKAGIPVAATPLPPRLHALCGICLRISGQDAEQAIRILAENSLTTIEVFQEAERDGEPEYIRKKNGQ